jgi:hypothetical protein
LADANAPAREVRVEAGEAGAIGDFDQVAVSLEPARLTDRDHRSGLRGANLERAEDSNVDPGMHGAERRRDDSPRGP